MRLDIAEDVLTFEVRRVTPGMPADHAGTGVQRALRAALPFQVEVTSYPISRQPDYISTCRCRTVFRLTDDAVRWLRKRGMLRQQLQTGPNPCVCLCMGKVID